jgi:hypothetical protein
MAYTQNAKFVTEVYPKNTAVDVLPTVQINILFGRDIDTDTINTNTFLVQRLPSREPVLGTVSYGMKRATFIPNSNLEPGATYCVILVGEHENIACIKDIVGNSMQADYTFSFTVSDENFLPPPILIYPVDEQKLAEVKFSFSLVEGASHYQLVVSKAYDFNNFVLDIIIPPSDILISDDMLTFVPDMINEQGEYFWRVRTYNEENICGPWSPISRYVIYEEESDDEPGAPGGDNEILVPLGVTSTLPIDMGYDVRSNIITLYFSSGNIDESTVTIDSIKVYRKYIDNPKTYIVTGSSVIDGNKITFTMDQEIVPSNIYAVTVSGIATTDEVLMDEYTFSFQSYIEPCYCDIGTILDDIGPFISSVDKATILRYIYRSSMFVDQMAKDQALVPDPATNELVPSYEVQQFVRYDVELALFGFVYKEKVDGIGETVQLADFTIKKSSGNRLDIEGAYKDIVNARLKWYDAIMGHHNRRFALVEHASKGRYLRDRIENRGWRKRQRRVFSTRMGLE